MKAYDIVVIGGGAIGLSVAYHAREAGLGSVVVLERHAVPGAESSSKANGGIRAQFATAINIHFSMHSIRSLRELDDATDGLPGFKQAGYLFMTGSAERAAAIQRSLALQVSHGVPARWLEPAAILEQAPFVKPDGLVGGTFCAIDGIFDPGGLLAAYWQQCRRLDVNFIFQTSVTGLRLDPRGIVVETSSETIRAGAVVNAAGAYATPVAAMLGVDLPVFPQRRNLACTEPAPGYPATIPMCVDLDTGVLIRREAEGFLLAYSNPDDPAGYAIDFDDAFLDDLADRVPNRFPFLSSIPIDRRKCWAGLYPETPDHHAIVGAAPGIGGFIQCVGFGGHGLMHSPAAGKAVSELLEHGVCQSFDLHALRPSRFAEGDLTVEAAVL
jgi:sarcosine oxidase, subunit beta